MQFTDLPLCDSLLEGLQAMNFKEATPVQEQAIPVILEKKDVIACAQTGTGKTAAFLLPLLNNLQTDEHDEGKINAIIMAPTRELAQQIDQQMRVSPTSHRSLQWPSMAGTTAKHGACRKKDY